MTSIFDVEKVDDFRWRSGAGVFKKSRRRFILWGAFAIFLLVCLATPNTTYTKDLRNRIGTRLTTSTAVAQEVIPQQPALPLFSDLKATKVAAIIESRPLNTLIPLLVHYSGVLGPSWPIALFTNNSQVVDDVAHRFWLAERNIYIIPLSKNLTFMTHYDISEWLASPWIWEQLAPAEHVFLFQSDSIICANAKQKVDDYLEWDLIGAPIPKNFGFGYNGGFSLRNRSLVLDVIEHHPFAKDSNRTSESTNRNQFEDQWFYLKMSGMQAKLPEPWVAATFAVQQIYYNKPLGYHQVWSFLPEAMDEVRKWCPEIDLASDETLACVPPTC